MRVVHQRVDLRVGGRPKEVSKYGKDGSARGREPLGRPKIPIGTKKHTMMR